MVQKILKRIGIVKPIEEIIDREEIYNHIIDILATSVVRSSERCYGIESDIYIEVREYLLSKGLKVKTIHTKILMAIMIVLIAYRPTKEISDKEILREIQYAMNFFVNLSIDDFVNSIRSFIKVPIDRDILKKLKNEYKLYEAGAYSIIRYRERFLYINLLLRRLAE